MQHIIWSWKPHQHSSMTLKFELFQGFVDISTEYNSMHNLKISNLPETLKAVWKMDGLVFRSWTSATAEFNQSNFAYGNLFCCPYSSSFAFKHNLNWQVIKWPSIDKLNIIRVSSTQNVHKHIGKQRTITLHCFTVML